MLRIFLFFILAGLSGCDEIKAALGDTLETCSIGCSRVQDCGASPPIPDYGMGVVESTGFEGLDCAAGCADENRSKIGYSDCQLECLETADCDSIQDCWNAGSAVFAEYCASDAPQVGPSDGVDFDNGSTTGSTAVDEAVENPAVKDAVEQSGFTINFGDSPPEMDDGVFYLDWVIAEQNNSRAVGTGSPQDICLWENETDPEANWKYCQIGGLSLDLHWIGKDDLFTLVVVDDLYQGYISGRVEQGDSGTQLVDVQTLFVYLWGPDIWEKQTWSADWVDEIGQCQTRVSGFCPI